MLPDQPPNDNVWISREEYDRLRQQAGRQQPAVIVGTTPAKTTSQSLLTVMLVILGVLFYGGLTIGQFSSRIYMIVILALLVIAAGTSYRFIHGRMAQQPQPVISNNAAAAPSTKRTLGKVFIFLLICFGAVFTLPFVALFGLMIILSITGAGQGS